MCSFLITTILVFMLDFVNYYQKFRGPDATNDVIINNIRFIHNLLHMTGNMTFQPFMNSDSTVVCLFNGEIYNYKKFGNYKSDGQCLIDLYTKHGKKFIRELDGEFAIVLFDFNKNIFICSSDVFATKPIWYAIENDEIGIASYKSSLTRLKFTNPIKISANTTIVFSLKGKKILETLSVFDFDLEQKKSSYDDWILAFDNAICKRAKNTNYSIFVCLSSGYDSGIICCALNKHNIKYTTYTITSNENTDTLEKRFSMNKLCSEKITIELLKSEYMEEKKYIKKYCEDAEYNIPFNKCTTNVSDDKGATGMSFIFRKSSAKKQRVYLSGQGGDEIYSDYGYNGKKFYKHSQFGGLFPDNLKEIFPWNSFYEGTQMSYLSKEENISGLHGIEGRYPLLDKYVVQEFLWLTPELKNKYYKGPIHAYLEAQSYPFDINVKIGFEADSNLH